MSEHDYQWMQHALALAKIAALNDEVPVGAVLVLENNLIAEGWNQSIKRQDPTAHAEIIALREGGKALNNYRLVDTTLYVTLEPCAMCVGALVHARVKRVVFGANDPKAGAVMSALQLAEVKAFNHQIQYESGLLAEECSLQLRKFFAEKRKAQTQA